MKSKTEVKERMFVSSVVGKVVICDVYSLLCCQSEAQSKLVLEIQ